MSNIIYWKPGSEVSRSRNGDVSHYGLRYRIWKYPELVIALIRADRSELFYSGDRDTQIDVAEDLFNNNDNRR